MKFKIVLKVYRIVFHQIYEECRIWESVIGL